MKFISTTVYKKKAFEKLSFYFILIFTIENCLFQPAEAGKKRQKLKFCKLDVLHHCFYEPISAFTNPANGTGFPVTEADLEQWCFSLHDYVPYCCRAWMRQCAGSPLHEAAFTELIQKPFQLSMRGVCSNQTARNEFLLHAPCMVHKVKLTDHYRDSCVRHFQGDFEVAGNHTRFGDYFRASCCAYNAWERCITGQLSEQCGPPAGAIFATFIRHLGFHVFPSFCPVEWYNPEKAEQCPPKLYRAPEGFIPLGLKSTSFFSRAFAIACPNAAFGVESSRKDVG